MPQDIPRSRSISQILSRAGYPSAGVRQRHCGYIVPENAHGYGCAEMVCGPWPESTHQWRGVEISWYGDDEPPFREIVRLLHTHGYEAADVNPRSLNTSRPSITVWFPDADKEQASD